MIPLVMRWTGVSRAAVYGLAALMLVALVALGAGWSLAAWRGMLADAHAAGKAQADAQWREQIAKSEAAVAAARADQTRIAAEADARAAQDRAALSTALAELEKANAALPSADACGLDRNRVRLLPR